MEYRTAEISGEFDHDSQIVLRNQDWQGNLGVHIFTPLMIEGEKRAILVDRGGSLMRILLERILPNLMSMEWFKSKGGSADRSQNH